MAGNGIRMDQTRGKWELTNDNYLNLINWKYVNFNNEIIYIFLVDFIISN